MSHFAETQKKIKALNALLAMYGKKSSVVSEGDSVKLDIRINCDNGMTTFVNRDGVVYNGVFRSFDHQLSVTLEGLNKSIAHGRNVMCHGMVSRADRREHQRLVWAKRYNLDMSLSFEEIRSAVIELL